LLSLKPTADNESSVQSSVKEGGCNHKKNIQKSINGINSKLFTLRMCLNWHFSRVLKGFF